MTTETKYKVRFVHGDGYSKGFYHCGGKVLSFNMEKAIQEGITMLEWMNECINKDATFGRQNEHGLVDHLELVPLKRSASPIMVKKKYRVDIVQFKSKQKPDTKSMGDIPDGFAEMYKWQGGLGGSI